MSGHGGDDDEIHEEHEEHGNHEAWVIPYADLLTLLMAMFIALFAISSVDTNKAKRLELGFSQASKRPLGTLFSGGGNSPVDTGNSGGGSNGDNTIKPGSTPKDKPNFITSAAKVAAAQAKERKSFWNIKTQIEKVAKSQGLGDKVSFQLEGRGLVVRLVNDNVLFASGQAAIEPEGERLLGLVGGVLKSIDNPLLIDGYTDSQPISGGPFASNWELSTSRAGSVLRFLSTSVGLDESRMTPMGHAYRSPIGDNNTAEGRARNRRVEIVIESKIIDQILRANDLTSEQVQTNPSPTGSAKPNLKNVVGDLSTGK